MIIKKVEHAALIVNDMDQSIQYYSELFGFVLRARGESKTREMAFLRHPNQPGFEIELIQDIVPQGPYSQVGIVNHLAFTVDDIEQSMRELQVKGIQFLSQSPGTGIDGAKTVFFYGPNQELLQLYQPNREEV